MAGIMPDGGVPPSSAFNSLNDAPLVGGCDSLWHAPRCTPRFDPASANAIISELLNVIELAGLDYDCTQLDNLADAVRIHEISGNGSVNFDGGSTPIAILNGLNRKIGGGSFTIPNTFHRNVRVFLYADMTVQWNHDNAVDATSALDIDGRLGLTADLLGQQPNFTVRPRGDDRSLVINDSYMRVFDVPPGGLQVFWDVRSSKSGPGEWTLPYTGTAIAFRMYGTSAHTRDVVSFGD